MAPSTTGTTPAALPAASAIPVPEEWLTVTPTQAAERFIDDNPRLRGGKEGTKRARTQVGEQTLRQIRWACQLLEYSVPENTAMWQVTEIDIKRLDSQFDRLPIAFGKSPSDRTPDVRLEAVIERAASKVADGELALEEVGLTFGTTNKHFNKLAQVHAFVREFVPATPMIDISKFIFEIDAEEREARLNYEPEQSKAIFSLPPWVGCAGSADRLTDGSTVIHDALFFVLLLVWYTGARREELCKLMLDDIEERHGIWYLLIRPTEMGRIKNRSSRRVIAICDELLRLAFMRYVEALRQDGERLLFPELVPSGGTKRKLGDVFYKLSWIYIAPQVPNLVRGQAMHAARHMVSTELKDQETFIEFRNDLLGHKGKGGEGENRYPARARLIRLKELVDRIPIVTEHLVDQNVMNLLPSSMRQSRPSRGD